MKAVLLLKKRTVANKESYTTEIISQTWVDICTHCLKTVTGSVSRLQSEKNHKKAFQGGRGEDSVQ